MVTKGLDIRDLACDGYGLTAVTSGMNRYVAKYLEKLTAGLEKKPEQHQANSKEPHNCKG